LSKEQDKRFYFPIAILFVPAVHYGLPPLWQASILPSRLISDELYNILPWLQTDLCLTPLRLRHSDMTCRCLELGI